MKLITLEDDAEGNAKGWNPDGSTALFFIQDADVGNNSVVVVSADSGDPNNGCGNVVIFVDLNGFDISCSHPGEGSKLNYVVINPP